LSSQIARLAIIRSDRGNQHRNWKRCCPGKFGVLRFPQTKRLADEEVKRQSDAEGELAVTVSGYQAYKENRSGIDYTTTEMVQRELKTIVVRVAGKKDFVRALAAARVVIQQIPDRPKIGDVNKIVQRIANQQREAAENPAQKDTWAQRPR